MPCSAKVAEARTLVGGIAFSRTSYTDTDHKCDVTSRNGIATKSSIACHLPMWMIFRRMVATTYKTTLYGQKHHELTFPRIISRRFYISLRINQQYKRH